MQGIWKIWLKLQKFVKGDICDKELVLDLLSNCDAIINFAAESHVDRSIESPDIFIQTNVNGTVNLLNCARAKKIERFIQISTDEVYGSIKEGYFTETTPISPNSPYSSSKASADLFVQAYFKTYGLPALITRCSNNYGPYQYPEKLIPFFRIVDSCFLCSYYNGYLSRCIRIFLEIGPVLFKPFKPVYKDRISLYT